MILYFGNFIQDERILLNIKGQYQFVRKKTKMYLKATVNFNRNTNNNLTILQKKDSLNLSESRILSILAFSVPGLVEIL